MDEDEFDALDLGDDFTPEELGENLVQEPDSTTNESAKKVWNSIFSRQQRVPRANQRHEQSLEACLEGDPQSKKRLHRPEEIPEPFSSIFSDIQYFNYVQSTVFDDLLYSKNSIAVCAPTGAGKTVLFEFAIIKAIMDYSEENMGRSFTSKIIYLCPLKALCNERHKEWTEKFGPLGLSVCEVTGDTESDEYIKVHRSNIIITTPEKWDSVTRKWKDNNKNIMDQTKLICIDEVHLLSEPERGASLEAIVSRVKTAKMIERKSPALTQSTPGCRFVAVSATAPNIDDVSEWIGFPSLPGKHFKFSNECRPIKVNTSVIGFNHNGNPFQFDSTLNHRVAEVINVYGGGKPSLVFCISRKSCEEGAKTLAKISPRIEDYEQRQEMLIRSKKLNNTKLREVFEKGIAYHHAGLDYNDRSLVEQTFAEGLLFALFSTSTLAMGVNLPAHLVVLKGTYKMASAGATEFTETDILQMTGRAGRPQFDISANAVIMCPRKDVDKFRRLVNGEKTLESFLHKHLPEHLNAEIVLRTVTDVSVALDWLKSTFFYIRCLKNRSYYDIPKNGGQEAVEMKLKNMTMRELHGLEKFKMITMTQEENGSPASLHPTEVGRLMAKLYISYDTMKNFVDIPAKTPLKDLLFKISECKELTSETSLRPEDKKFLYAYHDLKVKTVFNKIRYPRTSKIKSIEEKIYTLLQTEFGCFSHDDEELQKKYKNDVTRLLRMGCRMTKCLLEFMTLPNIREEKGYQTVRNAIILNKIFKRGIWENSPYVVKQFEGIGPAISSHLVRRGNLTSFEAVGITDARTLEGLAGKKSPWGQQIKDMAKTVPRMSLKVRQVSEGPDACKVLLYVFLANKIFIQNVVNKKDGKKKTNLAKSYSVFVLVGNSDDKILLFHRFSEKDLLEHEPQPLEVIVTKSVNSPKNKFFVGILNDTWIGSGPDLQKLEYEVEFTYFSAVVDRILTTVTKNAPQLDDIQVSDHEGQDDAVSDSSHDHPVAQSEVSASFIPDTTQEKFRCHHRCKNKEICSHRCCKSSTAVLKESIASQFPSRKRLSGSGDDSFSQRVSVQLSLQDTHDSVNNCSVFRRQTSDNNHEKLVEEFLTQKKQKLDDEPTPPVVKKEKDIKVGDVWQTDDEDDDLKYHPWKTPSVSRNPVPSFIAPSVSSNRVIDTKPWKQEDDNVFVSQNQSVVRSSGTSIEKPKSVRFEDSFVGDRFRSGRNSPEPSIVQETQRSKSVSSIRDRLCSFANTNLKTPGGISKRDEGIMSKSSMTPATPSLNRSREGNMRHPVTPHLPPPPSPAVMTSMRGERCLTKTPLPPLPSLKIDIFDHHRTPVSQGNTSHAAEPESQPKSLKDYERIFSAISSSQIDVDKLLKDLDSF